MDISKIDKNFEISCIKNFTSKCYNAEREPFILNGGFHEEKRKFEKIPFETAEKIGEGVLWGSGCSAGMRLTFSTDSDVIKIRAKLRDKCVLTHMTVCASAGFSLTEDEDDKLKFIGNIIPNISSNSDICEGELTLKGGKMRNYVLHLPLYSGVDELFLEFNKSSRLDKFDKYQNSKKILYYGSSITQGGCVSKTNNTYQQLISEWTKTDYTILGFSGSAKAEPLMIEYLKDFVCDIFVCDYDHNAPNSEYLTETHEKLYVKFRENPKHKNVPVVFVTKPNDLKDLFINDRFEIINSTYKKYKRKGENVYLVDGRKFYPQEVAEHCSVDGCHPNDLGMYFMAKEIFSVIKEIIK